MRRKLNSRYYFTVEGETEKWYLEWLRDAINADSRSICTISCSPKVQKYPSKWAKSHTNLERKAEVFHVFDFEDESEEQSAAFKSILADLKKANGLGRGFKFINTYSNLTFEVWMILHKGDCSACSHRNQYLTILNRLYGEQFQSLKEYKRENNFKRLLRSLTIDDVLNAVKRAEKLSRRAQSGSFRTAEHCGYSYYLDNPISEVWVPVKRILSDSGLLLY